MKSDPERWFHCSEPYSRGLPFALDALRMFSAAGRWTPAERLVWYYGLSADEDPEGVFHYARIAVYRLRRQGYNIERDRLGLHAYRLVPVE